MENDTVASTELLQEWDEPQYTGTKLDEKKMGYFVSALPIRCLAFPKKSVVSLVPYV